MYTVLIVVVFFTREKGEELRRLLHKMKIAHQIFLVSGDSHMHAHTCTCTHSHSHSHSHTHMFSYGRAARVLGGIN